MIKGDKGRGGWDERTERRIKVRAAEEGNRKGGWKKMIKRTEKDTMIKRGQGKRRESERQEKEGKK